MKLKKQIVISTVLLLIFLFSCSGPASLYHFDFPLSSELALSKTTDLSVNVPRGWFTAEDNKDDKIDLWLVEENYAATISFIRLNPDEETKRSFGKYELQKVEDFSRLNNKIAHRDKYIDLIKNESFELNGREFRAYQFSGSKYLYRTVVFRYKNYFYECTAAVKPGQNENETLKVFSVQNSVLQSIK